MSTQNDLHSIPDEILDLQARYIAGTLNEQEEKVLNSWKESHPEAVATFRTFTENFQKVQWLHFSHETSAHSAWEKINHRIQPRSKRKPLYLQVAAIAALVLLGMVLGWYVLQSYSPQEEEISLENPLPERNNKAVLVLSNGDEFILDHPEQTEVNESGGTTIKNKPGLVLAYQPTGKDQHEIVYNDLIVPAGARYQLQLEDGTRIWMNAVSKLRYPVVFGTDERRVTLSGEAYFEVAEDINRPFIVETNGYEISVLGTRFNVSTYEQDAYMETALVDGVVRVSPRQGDPLILQPGQKVKIDHSTQTLEVKTVDTRFYTSWKDGVLHFNKVSLEELMVKLERWYAVEIEFRNPEAKELIYSGAMENSRKIEFLLNLIEQTADVEFEIENDRIIVH